MFVAGMDTDSKRSPGKLLTSKYAFPCNTESILCFYMSYICSFFIAAKYLTSKMLPLKIKQPLKISASDCRNGGWNTSRFPGLQG